MNRNITNRRELLLAKIAGRDVDINTMTPPVPINLEEELMIEIADRLEGGGGGGDVDGITGATVTFHLQNPEKYMWGGECVAIQDGVLYGRVGQLGDDIDTVVTALLYNGEGSFRPDAVNVISVTGDAEYVYGTVHIYGDCTINIDGNYPD